MTLSVSHVLEHESESCSDLGHLQVSYLGPEEYLGQGSLDTEMVGVDPGWVIQHCLDQLLWCLLHYQGL